MIFNKVNSNTIYPIILIIGALFVFVPLILNYNSSVESDDVDKENIDLQYQHSYALYMAFASSIAVMLPFLFEYLLELLFFDHNIDRTTQSSIFWNISHRNSFICFITPDIYLLLVAIPLSQFNFILAFICSRDIMFTTYFIYLLIQVGSPVWNPNCYIFIGGLTLIANISIDYVVLFPNITSYDLHVFLIVIITILFSFVIYYSITWYLSMESSLLSIRTWKKRDILCLVHIICLIVYLIVDWYGVYSFHSITGKWSCIKLGPNFLALYTCVVTFCFVVIYIASMILNRVNMLEARKLFIREIGHEIRTPLNCASMGLECLSDNILNSHNSINMEKNKESIEDIKQSLQDAVQVLNDLLLFDKLESGTLNIENICIHPMKILKEIELFSLQAKSKNIKYTNNIESWKCLIQDYIVYGDFNKLKQVLRNVISNAIKFTESDIGMITIDILFYNSNTNDNQYFNYLKISVTDNGPGISKENQKKMFKSAIQFNPGVLQNGGGSGLGLFISSRIMGVHNGTISVYSEGEGTGCCFTIEIPITHMSLYTHNRNTNNSKNRYYNNLQEEMDLNSSYHNFNKSIYGSNESFNESLLNTDDDFNDIPPPIAIDRIPITIIDNLSHIRTTSKMNDLTVPSNRREDGMIVIVDDSKMNRKMLNRLLSERINLSFGEKFNYKIEEYKDGLEVLNRITNDLKQGLDVVKIILIDYQMPIMDGIASVRAMRKIGYRGYIIMITGNALQDDQSIMYAAGVDHIIIKPIQKDKLFHLVDEYYLNFIC